MSGKLWCFVGFCGLMGVSACTESVPDDGVYETVWSLASVDGAAFGASATLNLAEDGRIFGNAPCNAYVGRSEGVWPALRFSSISVTRAACPELSAEQAFLQAMAGVRSVELTDQGMLLTGEGAPLLFRPRPAE